MKVSTNKYDILESGSVIVPVNEYVEFDIEGLRYRFLFINDNTEDSKGVASISGSLTKDDQGDYFAIEVKNYKGLFYSPSDLIKVGELGGKDLYVYFSIVTVSDDNNAVLRVFHYTWYILKKQTNGAKSK